jgi:hypothetical protein
MICKDFEVNLPLNFESGCGDILMLDFLKSGSPHPVTSCFSDLRDLELKSNFTRQSTALPLPLSGRTTPQIQVILALLFKNGRRNFIVRMASPSKSGKRKFASDAAVSPPPLKRKVQSTTTRELLQSQSI